MAENSKIEWTDATWNPLRGCTRVSEGCRNCYAEIMAGRFSDPGQWGHGIAERTGSGYRWTGGVDLMEDRLLLPLRWHRPRRIFVASIGDPFHPAVPDEWIDQIFAVMALCPQHIFQVLTKRPERMREYFDARRDGDPWSAAADRIADLRGLKDHPAVPEPDDFPLRNVWLGVSVEDQTAADERIPHLLATPAAVRFLSCEPLLGPVDLADHLTPRWWGSCPCGIGPTEQGTIVDRNGVERCPACNYALGGAPEPLLHWVIVGGESGPGARPMHPDWARSLRDQCALAGVPFHFKQFGEFREFDGDNPVEEYVTDAGFSDAPSPRDLGAIRPVFVGGDGGVYHALADAPVGIPVRLMERVGKKRAGRLLDGAEHDGMPGGAP